MWHSGAPSNATKAALDSHAGSDRPKSTDAPRGARLVLYRARTQSSRIAAVSSHTTRWTVIRGAARGDSTNQAEFARHYGPVIRAYLGARWRQTPLIDEVDDAAQQVFLDCFKEDGALGRADPAREGGFGAFLYGVVRNVARGDRTDPGPRASERQPTSSVDLDAHRVRRGLVRERLRVRPRVGPPPCMRDAAELQLRARAGEGPRGRPPPPSCSTLRYGENLPIREIAREAGRSDADHAPPRVPPRRARSSSGR